MAWVNQDYYTQHSRGSAWIGTEEDAQALSKGAGPIGRIGDTVLRFRTAEPTIIFGGAGSGKFSNLGAYQLVHPSTQSFFVLDMGGQYQSVTWHQNLAMGREAYSINPHGISAYKDINLPVDLWGILKPHSPYLFDNSRRIGALALRDNAKGDNAWVFEDAARLLARMKMARVYLDGRVTPASLWEMINACDSDDDAFKQAIIATENLPYDISATLLEFFTKKYDAPKEWGAVISKIKSDLDWLSSPSVAASVSGDEDYLSYLADPNKKVGVYYCLEGGSGSANESLTRMVIGIAMLHCVRAEKGHRPLFYLDEAATCGKAEFIKLAASEYRKYFRTVFVYQSKGQLDDLFTKAGATTIIDSCGQIIVMGGGISDVSSAKYFADMCGKATVFENDNMAQGDRRRKAKQAWHDSLWNGADPVAASRTYHHEMNQSRQQRQVTRDAMDANEFMRLTNQVVVFTPRLGLPAIVAEKMPNYWQNRAMAGKYGPDPMHPPMDRVNIQGRFFGTITRKFIRQSVPDKLAHMPNHINGEVCYVEGFKTF